MSFYIPAGGAEDWRNLLPDPRRRWKPGGASRALAYCWQEGGGFPEEVRRAFRRSAIRSVNALRPVIGIPGYKVPLPPKGSPPSYNDIFIIAAAERHLSLIMVEGKASEPFGQTVAGWGAVRSASREKRLIFLCNQLRLRHSEVQRIRYQFLHWSVAALREAKRFCAENAIVLIHSFSPSDEWISEYKSFLELFGAEGAEGSIVPGRAIGGINLCFGWVRGKEEYLYV